MPSTRSLIHSSKLSSVATLLVVLASCVSVEAQSTSSIEELVTDQNGDIVPAVTVSLMGQAIGVEPTAVSDELGQLMRRILAPPLFTLSALLVHVERNR